ncbi:HNH endonuclease [Leclercia sp. LTM14]|uniref:HNH endonuclease n=2 Tax=Enterobacteriaceae TaxID=543 RepID=A0ABS7RT19_9ENTR|nr:HNH endonuclease [Leclercia sp. EMC7]MCM5700033.1 HNH endonuclease [Leclercia sp. LTM14]
MNPKPRRYYYFALYRPVTPHQVNLRVHHVVWFLTHGYQSMQLIDHINGDPLDNRPVNLRQATRNQNIRNQVKHCVTEGSPYKGIHRRTGATRFVSSISADNLTTRLGSFTDPIVAARTYDLASICLHGEYGRRNFPDSDYSPEQIATMRDYLQAKRQPATSGTIH